MSVVAITLATVVFSMWQCSCRVEAMRNDAMTQLHSDPTNVDHRLIESGRVDKKTNTAPPADAPMTKQRHRRPVID